MPATRTPQLDVIKKPKASATTKVADKQLAKLQTLLLDTLALLASVVEFHNKGKTLDQRELIQAAKTAIKLLGNANAHLSHLRREGVISSFNKSLLLIIRDDANFVEATPLLFGMEFARKGKEMVDQMKVMRYTVSRKTDRKPPFFRGGSPSSQET